MIRVRIGLVITSIGFIISMIGIRPSIFGLGHSPLIGFVKIAVFLVGLAFICIGGYLSLASLRRRSSISIAADIGLRLVATGYLICVFSGMADIFGFGSQPPPGVPYFGPLQALA